MILMRFVKKEKKVSALRVALIRMEIRNNIVARQEVSLHSVIFQQIFSGQPPLVRCYSRHQNKAGVEGDKELPI